MPRDGSGNYSKPAGTTAVTLTEIASGAGGAGTGDYNVLMDDIASELTASLPRDGSAAMTGSLNLGGFALATDGLTGLDTTGLMTLSGGSTTSLGARLLLYAEAHPSSALDARINSSADEVYWWDDSEDKHRWYAPAGSVVMSLTGALFNVTATETQVDGAFDLNGSADIRDNLDVGGITTLTGNLTVNGTTTTVEDLVINGTLNGSPISLSIPQWQEDYTTAVTNITTTIPNDSSTPLSTEGQQVGSIASVVVAAGDQVEIDFGGHVFTNNQGIAFTLFRDSTFLDSVVSNNNINLAAHPTDIETTFVDDDPGAGTYTYSVRVGSLGGTSNVRLNARNAAGDPQFGGGVKSGIRIRVLPA